MRSNAQGLGRTASPRSVRGFKWRVGGAAVLIVTAFMAVLCSWLYRTPATHVRSGIFQADMLTYTCSARMAARSPTLLTYANPHDMREPPAAVNVSLPITVMGVLLRVMSPGWVENLLRLLFGVTTYLALGAVLRRMFGEGRWFWAAYMLIGVCAGVTWVAALFGCPGHPAGGLGCVAELETSHYWWGLSLLRNLMYPLELVYHTILFLQLAALIDRRLRLANGLFVLGVLCNPFLAIQMLGAQLACALLQPDASRLQRVLPFLAAACLFTYYGLLLPLDPVTASVQAQHTDAYPNSLSPRDMVLGHGPAVLGLLVLLSTPFRRWLFGQSYGMPLVVFTAWTLLLTQHERLHLGRVLQPLHFTRGYLVMGMVCLLLVWLRHAAESRPRLERLMSPLLSLWIVLTLPDNLSFMLDRFRVMPAEMRWPVHEVAQFVGQHSIPRRVMVPNTMISQYLCTTTNARVLFGAPPMTPDFPVRSEQAIRFQHEAATARDVGGYGIDSVIIPIQRARVTQGLRRNPAWRLAYANEAFEVFFRVP